MKLFDSVNFMKPKLNKFDLSQKNILSMNMGFLIPVLLEDVVPGDRFRAKTEALVRFAPLLAPTLGQVNCYFHSFFIPLRLIWSESEDFLTGGRLGTAMPVPPSLSIDNTNKGLYGKGNLADYLGIPAIDPAVTVGTNYSVSALPFRAYQVVYDEYFRDQNVIADLVIPKSSGAIAVGSPEEAMLTELRVRAWEKDYFTSAQPQPQRGTAVSAPITGSVDPDGLNPLGMRAQGVRKVTDGSLSSTGHLQATTGVETVVGDATSVYHEIIGTGIVSGDMNITELRRSLKLQEFLEKMATGGARYIEQIKAVFGVVSDDARLQRPEYLGGGRNPVVISEVLSTFQDPSGTDLPQGNMAGHGISVGATYGWSRQFKEHGYVITLMSVLPRTTYQQGIPRHFLRQDRFDYFWPEFARIGEQPIIRSEIFQDWETGDPAENEVTFGWQSRYSEYKFGRDQVHGDMRDNLAFWHWGRIFPQIAPPALNELFVSADPTYRVFAVTDPSVHHLYVSLYHKIDALRPMPYFGTPSI